MKTSISADGTLVIAAETHLEGYALRKWSEENFTADWYNAAAKDHGMKIMVRYLVDCSVESDPRGFVPLTRRDV